MCLKIKFEEKSMRIITVSREFGSGGREVAKRLADELGFAYYDSEIINEIAAHSELDPHYVEHMLESGTPRNYVVTYSRSFHIHTAIDLNITRLYAVQNKVIREIASRGDCVIVGRGADMMLRDRNPFRIFVYADMESRIERCLGRMRDDEKLTLKELQKKIKQIDRGRAETHNIISDIKWGDKKGYELCINTTGVNIKALIPYLAEYAKNWFEDAQV